MSANDNKRPKLVPDPLAYGVAQAANAMSVSETTVWEWIRQGRVATVKIGGRTLIRREELLRFLDEAA